MNGGIDVKNIEKLIEFCKENDYEEIGSSSYDPEFREMFNRIRAFMKERHGIHTTYIPWDKILGDTCGQLYFGGTAVVSDSNKKKKISAYVWLSLFLADHEGLPGCDIRRLNVICGNFLAIAELPAVYDKDRGLL